MTAESGITNLIDAATAGVENLAKSATSALGQLGPVGELLQPVVNTLRDVWEGYFGTPIPPGHTNWNAYSHKQLYAMLWHNADIEDVNSVASAWGQHSSELLTQAKALRDQATTLQQNWSGAASQPAVDQLNTLGAQTQKLGEQAATTQKAIQSAADALALARKTMPPPPGVQPGSPPPPAPTETTPAPTGSFFVIGAPPPAFGAGPGASMGSAMGAVGAGSTSMFGESAQSADAKAQAVHVMMKYENNLTESGNSISSMAVQPTTMGQFGAGTTATNTAGYAAGAAASGAGGTGGGVPWKQLVGNGIPSSSAAGELRSGAVSSALDNATLAKAGLLSEEGAAATSAAEGGMLGGGMMPMTRGMGSQSDKEHRNRFPSSENPLFKTDGGATVPVIGL